MLKLIKNYLETGEPSWMDWLILPWLGVAVLGLMLVWLGPL